MPGHTWGAGDNSQRLSSGPPCLPPAAPHQEGLAFPSHPAWPLLTAGLGARPGCPAWGPVLAAVRCLGSEPSGNGTRPAQTVENLPSMGVLGSGRLANTTSTYSSCSRSREAFRPGGGVRRDRYHLHTFFWALPRASDERHAAPGTGSKCHLGSRKARMGVRGSRVLPVQEDWGEYTGQMSCD